MIGIDTNVLVRFLTQDDPEQAARATRALNQLSAKTPGYLTTAVLIETYWVLTRAYDEPTEDVLQTLRALIDNPSIATQDAGHHLQALDLAQHRGAEYPDALIDAAARAKGCSAVLSFDQQAIKTLGFTAP